MLTASSDFFSARRVSSPNSDNYDDLTDFNASFPSVDTLQFMMDDEEAEFTIKVDGIQIGGTMSAMSGPARYLSRTLSEESWSGDAEFVVHIDSDTFETHNS